MPTDDRDTQMRELARSHMETAIATLADVMTDEEAKSAARVRASEVMLAYGFGAPSRKVEQTIDVTIMDERQAHLTALQRLAADKNKKALPAPASVVDAEFEEVKDGK